MIARIGRVVYAVAEHTGAVAHRYLHLLDESYPAIIVAKVFHYLCNTVNNFNYTFEKMETTKLALHKAQLETKRIIGG